MGYAQVPIRGQFSFSDKVKHLSVRAVLLGGLHGKTTEWTDVPFQEKEQGFECSVTLPAGGWYRLEIKAAADTEVYMAAVEPVGIGEVFVVSGQSYAEDCSDAQYKIQDPEGRITVYDYKKKSWRVAHDPQPLIRPWEGSEKWGSIWPCTMNLLLPVVQVPIGLISAAVGATSTRQWRPGGELFERLVDAAQQAGDFRYLLWQQGESDVIEKTGTEQYAQRIVEIKKEFDSRLGRQTKWVLAKSTYHPSVYDEPEEEQKIRDAVDRLWRENGFLQGPDTDILGKLGVYRSGLDGASGHFTALGQETAGLMWFSTIWNHLQRKE